MIILPGPVVRGAGVSVAIGSGFVTGTTDEFGTLITSAPSVGWYGSPAMRHPGRSDRPGAHGSYPTRGYSEGRSIQIGGKGIAVDTASAIKSIRALSAVLADGAPDILTWFDPDESVVLSTIVERDDEVRTRWVGDRAFDWQMVLFAPDPRVYDEPVEASTSLPSSGSGVAFPWAGPVSFGAPPKSGSVVLTNTGTAPTEPTITASGPLAVGFQVVHVETGRRLRYEGAVGDPVVIDCREGTATSAGQDRTGLLTADDFFTIDPGATATFQWSTLGSETAADPAEATFTVAPANH